MTPTPKRKPHVSTPAETARLKTAIEVHDAKQREEEAGEEARAKLVREIRDLEPDDVENVLALIQVLKGEWGGCFSPIEEFIEAVMSRYTFSLRAPGRGITPENLQEDFDVMARNFESMIESCRRMRDQYPELLQTAGAEGNPPGTNERKDVQ